MTEQIQTLFGALNECDIFFSIPRQHWFEKSGDDTADLLNIETGEILAHDLTFLPHEEVEIDAPIVVTALETLNARWKESKTVAASIREEIESYLKPITKALGKELRGEIIEIRELRDSFYIITESYERGGPYRHSYDIPLSVLRNSDVLLEAAKFRQHAEDKEMNKERAAIERRIEYLKQQLDELK